MADRQKISKRKLRAAQLGISLYCYVGKRKVCHHSRRVAKDHLKGLEQEGSTGLHCYHCDSCGWWHVGHQTKKKGS